MRHRRLVAPGHPHHVLLRGNNRRKLFSYPRDYRRFIGYLVAATAVHDVALYHACLMPNHVHLLVAPADGATLARWVQAFAQRYAHHRNSERAATGKLFEQRFKSFVINDERYFEACTAYVELNPVRAGLDEQLADYPWSTYRGYAGNCECCN